MAKKIDPGVRLDAALLEMAEDFRGSIFSEADSRKITMRVLGKAWNRPPALPANDIRAMREKAGMSQAVFATILNVTTGYVSQLERGVKRPTGPALALLDVIRRKGIDAVL